MKKVAMLLLIFTIATSLLLGKEVIKHIDVEEEILTVENSMTVYEATMRRDILCLMMAYPEYITDIKKEADEKIYIVLTSGKKLLYDDKKKKTLDEKMHAPDIQDVLEQKYPLTKIDKLMEKDMDPGRVRMYSLLKEVYGSSQSEVQKNLKTVSAGGSFQFNKNDKASDSLKTAMQEVIALLKVKKGLSKFVFPTSGTFNYRVIAGTNLLSPHSFGIAIDLARDKKDYWRWASKELGQKRIEEYPNEIVEIFEKYNFVWGGKWSHFDILHYEYRPEIIMKARYFPNEYEIGKSWYDGVEFEDDAVGGYIKIIENKLQ